MSQPRRQPSTRAPIALQLVALLLVCLVATQAVTLVVLLM